MVEPASPLVSVVMANFNGARFVGAALQSALAQTLREIEVVVVDDASTDPSVALVSAVAARDPRVRLLTSDRNGGPAAARNHGLAAARGRWIAVMDSDDLMRPERLARLVAAAERDGADIVADNLLVFDDRRRFAPHPFLQNADAEQPRWINAATYVLSETRSGRGPSLGYLKPVFKAVVLERTGVRYDPSLRAGEDYDLVLRLLARGATFRAYPQATYLLRKHEASISHRFSAEDLSRMLAADDAFRSALGVIDKRLRRALDLRRRQIEEVLAFDSLVDALEQGLWRKALGLAWRYPRAVLLLRSRRGPRPP